MKIYWTLKDVPELSGLSQPERRRVHRACYWKAFRRGRCLTALLFCGLCGGLGCSLGWCLHWFLGYPTLIWVTLGLQGIGGGIGGGLGGLIFGQVLIDYLRPFYAKYIKTELRQGVA